MQLSILDGIFNLHRLKPKSPIPNLMTEQFYTIAQTSEELSVVCSDSIDIEADKTESDWRIIKVAGPLDFAMTGVIAKISKILAEAKISIFVISTFDTDYVMVKSSYISKAQTELERFEYQFD